MSFSFSDPSHAGWLEPVEIAARIVARTSLEGLGTGTYLLRLGSERLRPGAYLVRLSDGARAATRKLIVLQ